MKVNLERIMDKRLAFTYDGVVDGCTFYLAYSIFRERFMNASISCNMT